MSELKLPTLTCKRCGHSWFPRSAKLPKKCPNLSCGSPYWNREYVLQKYKKAAKKRGHK